MSDPDKLADIGSHATTAQIEFMRLHRLQMSKPSPRLNDRTLPARRLVEFRCRGGAKGGHLLGVIYQSQHGPLFVSTADSISAGTETFGRSMYESKRLHRELGVVAINNAPWNPSPRLPLEDEPFSSDDPCLLRCRCGSWPVITRDALRWAVDAQQQAASDLLVLEVSAARIEGRGGTLSITT